MKLSVIIVNYNVKYFLEQALLSVRRASRGLQVETWVVDNNSVDDSVPMVEEKFPEVRLIQNQDNPGFSIANNQAIRQSQGEYVLLLNPDTVVEEDTFEKCIAFMDTHPEAGGLGVRMIDGSGAFLPESKRGFPSPWVAFCKTVGLSRLFPRSRLFNRYHLGYLDEMETNEVEVLAGAFMFMRRAVLDEVGLLDETFFMYGEDIDLSYRIIQGGYKNFYLPDTSIIHYKGESTKKGSLNYVRAFYNAMIIFARKHFTGNKATVFVLMLQIAIYLRAGLTVLSNFFRSAYLPLLDGVMIYAGLLFLKDFWGAYHFKDPDYYSRFILYLNFPMYVAIWLLTVFFSGGYDDRYRLRRLVRGVLLGTLVLLAVYGLLEQEYRNSRALILLGAAWSLAATVGIRMLLHFAAYRHFRIGEAGEMPIVIVGDIEESERVQQLLHKAEVHRPVVGTVAPSNAPHDQSVYLSRLEQLDEVVHIYNIREVIFCSRDVPTQAVMLWMSTLGPAINYKIVPKESMSIIGSSSKNTAGELYTIDIRYNIVQAMSLRNKRVYDALFACFLLLTFPVQVLLVRQPAGLLRNAFRVLIGRYSWVGYAATDKEDLSLPGIRDGVLSPLDSLRIDHVDQGTRQRLNFFYAKDYNTGKDFEICWSGWRNLGRSVMG
ncbi:MAG: glycosyltransferase [Phaeodactylibacter sp.]|uniref:glycosyltransferase family 2 protein n=1 Tax=Phaeodactylibacter sp. TaxID=1940289 RepID=UPI0032EFABF1